MMNVQRAKRILQRMSDDSQCPKWIERLCVQLHHTYDCCALLVCDAKQIVEKYLKENQRRCLLLQRNDIMPMVLYLAQSRYSREHPKEYNPEKAKESFIELMDSVLAACYMEPFNEKNELDKLLLACFQEEEMYSYSDVLDAYYESV